MNRATPPPEPVKPRRRLLRTLLRRPRRLRRFAPQISLQQVTAELPEADELAHWGEVVLLEDVVVALHRDGTGSWLSHIVTMPFGDQHLAEWDEVPQAYEVGKSRPTVRRAVVHTPDGQRVKAQSRDLPINTQQRVRQLTFAPLRPGVVVEFEAQHDHFTLSDVGPMLCTEFMVRTLCPCRRRRFTVAVADPFDATVRLHHDAPEPTRTEHRGYRLWQWDFRQLEGIEVDPWTPPMRDFAPWIDIGTLDSWQPVVDHYRQELLPKPEQRAAFAQLAAELNCESDEPRQRLLAVYRYATRDVRYGRHPSEMHLHNIREPSKMLQDLRGDCKDKSSLMVALLAEMKIPAKIAVLLTAQNGRTPMLPSLRFDHAIVRARLDEQDVWLDPAAGSFALGDLPQNDQGVPALILDDGPAEIIEVPLDQPQRQQVERRYRGRLDAQGDYQFSAEVSARGDRAAVYRATLVDRNDDHRRRSVQQSVAEERPGAEVDEVHIGDVNDLSRDVTYGYRVKLPQWARRIHDLLLFRIPWAEPVDYVGPISAAERLHPLQVPGVMRISEQHEIDLPPGHTAYGLPYHVHHQCRWADYHCDVTCTANRIVCQRTLDLLGGIVPTDQFPEFQRFWETCVRADQTDVVLRRDGQLD